MSRALSDRMVKARKQHRCDMCDRIIDKGETHPVTVFVSGNDFHQSRTHTRCSANYWGYWRWLGWDLIDVDPETDFVDRAEFAEYIDRTCRS